MLRFLKTRWRQLLLATVVTFFTLELGLRAIYLATHAGTLEDLYSDPRLPPVGEEVRLRHILRPSPHRKVVYELKPGLDVVFQGARALTNDRGFPDGPIALEKAPGTRRILGLGDSVMFGWAVAPGERYMDLLEARLRSERGGRWETLVTAVPGYNLVMQVAVLEHYGLSYHPDLIAYGLNRNDAQLPNFVRNRIDVLSLDSFLLLYRRLVFRPSQFAFVTELDGRPAYQIRDLGGVPEEYHDLGGAKAFREALERLAALGMEHGIPVVLFEFESRGPMEELVATLPDGLVHVDAREAAEAAGESFPLSPEDEHPSVAGHRLLADALFEGLAEQGLLDRLDGG